jgi:hypothetical protein
VVKPGIDRPTTEPIRLKLIVRLEASQCRSQSVRIIESGPITGIQESLHNVGNLLQIFQRQVKPAPGCDACW